MPPQPVKPFRNAAATDAYQLTISPAVVGRGLAGAILCLTLMHILVQIAFFVFGRDHLLGLRPLFDMNQENNIPTWYSGMVFAAASAALAVVAAARHQARAPYARHWTLLAFVFLYLSLDELTRIHENWGPLLEQPLGFLRDPGVLGGALRNLWVIPAFLLAAAFGAAYLRFLLHLPRRTRTLFVVSGVAFVAAAVGMEMIGASYSAAGGRFKPGFMVLVTVEEAIEMASIALFLYAVLDYAASTIGSVLVRIPHPKHAR